MRQPRNGIIDQERAARAAEPVAAETQHFAALGRYVAEMRHSFNNAMTSLLGNAELLLMEPDTFPTQAREQLKTIRAMALRLHQMMQRFSSLEAELEIAAENSQTENQPVGKSRAV
ncbi:MAG TPA: histidine kinase dimerization/phospho-acceptor domain-containing protein [Terriglobales bacterium]|jgi:signal transduction histidine kinase|nr:histidine kinase dimerization/phospho-acceptor domain-containing protein [Terriglobales bacterium]